MRVGDFVVMRYGVLIGYSNGRRIISLATRTTTLALALDAARHLRQLRPADAFWIIRTGQRAHVKPGGQS